MTIDDHKQTLDRSSTQRGAALLVSLVILLVMTLLGVTASRTTMLQERMAGNMRNSSLALQAAETGLRDGEGWVKDQLGGVRPNPVDPANCNNKPCPVLTQNSLDPMADSTWSGNDVRTGSQLAGTAEPYQFFIEQQQVVRESQVLGQASDERAQIFYEITARGVGGDTNAVSILRSTYVLRF